MSELTQTLGHVFLRSSLASPTYLHSLSHDPADFVAVHIYDVMARDFTGEDDKDVLLGTVHAEHIRLGQALNIGVSWFDVMDTHSQDLMDIYNYMFKTDTTSYKAAFEKAIACDVTNCDLLYVPSDSVLDNVWGPQALHTLVQHYDNCGFVIVGVSGIMGAETAEVKTRAVERGHLLQELGFKQFKDTPFFFLNTAYIQKPLPSHLSDKQEPQPALA